MGTKSQLEMSTQGIRKKDFETWFVNNDTNFNEINYSEWKNNFYKNDFFST